MIEPININTGVVQPIEKTLPSEVTKGTAQAEAASKQDTAQISAPGREHEVYMSALKGLPDVRPDVVQKLQDSLRPSGNYPPLQAIDGMMRLFGGRV